MEEFFILFSLPLSLVFLVEDRTKGALPLSKAPIQILSFVFCYSLTFFCEYTILVQGDRQLMWTMSELP
jgi:hypothetical protein